MDFLDEYDLVALIYCACQCSSRYNNPALKLSDKETLDVDRKKVDGLVQKIFDNIDVEDIDENDIENVKIIQWIERVKKAVTSDLEEV
nr:MAG TPA: hypothetical protein [Caudoviricetes sp.]